MIELDKTYPDGRVFKYHKIGEPLIDLNNNKLNAIIKSWERKEDCEANTQEYVLFVCEIEFSAWNPELLEQLDTLVLTPPWKPFKSIFVEPETITLEDAKTKKRAKINEQRDLMEKAGFEYMGKMIDSNIISVMRISVATQSAQTAIATSSPFSTVWTCQDNSELELNAEQMLGMSIAVAQHANTLHLHAREKKALVDEAETIEEVEAITW